MVENSGAALQGAPGGPTRAPSTPRLGGRVELLSPAAMWAIDDALLTVLGLA
ncbi:MAG: hypothetical protein IPG46_09295 [Actinobacteria bacterium]|nr:hypothetical protein [Actinomycetota bacterium]